MQKAPAMPNASVLNYQIYRQQSGSMATDKIEGAKSKKGFVAIDIDGTALVEKIDKNFGYGLMNDQSHVRQTLIQYIRAAQEAVMTLLF